MLSQWDVESLWLKLSSIYLIKEIKIYGKAKLTNPKLKMDKYWIIDHSQPEFETKIKIIWNSMRLLI
jgi:hypothetical protein